MGRRLTTANRFFSKFEHSIAARYDLSNDYNIAAVVASEQSSEGVIAWLLRQPGVEDIFFEEREKFWKVAIKIVEELIPKTSRMVR